MLYLQVVEVLYSNPYPLHLSCGYVTNECLSLTKYHIIASILQHGNNNQIVLQTRNIHNILQSEGRTRLPLKGNYTDLGCAIPPIITHLNMPLEILLLQVTEELFVTGHVERSSIV